jgi:hypothetical protein
MGILHAAYGKSQWPIENEDIEKHLLAWQQVLGLSLLR